MAVDYEPVIEQTLRLVHSQLHRYQRQLTGTIPDAISIDQLRQGPLGQDLARLARIARGEEHAPAEEVFRSVRAVLDLLFWPAGADTYEVDHPFWKEPLGRMLSQAKWRSIEHGELMSIGAAADRLGVARPTIYRWMYAGTIESVRDDTSDRFYVLRRDIDQVQAEAERFAAEQDAILRRAPEPALPTLQ
jgi:excisionase family DNA binding protein